MKSVLSKKIAPHQLVPLGFLSAIQNGSVVGIIGWKTIYFRKLVLPTLDKKIILVTAIRDPYTPRHALEAKILDHPMILKWFTVNPSPVYYNHPKLVGVPIGVDRYDSIISLLQSYR